MSSEHSTTGRLAVRNTLWLTIGSYAGQLIGFCATLVLVRALTPEIFGYLSIGLFWSSLLGLSAKFGLYYSSIRQSTLDCDLLGTYFRLEAVLGGASFLISVVAAFILIQIGYSPQVGLVIIISAGIACISVLTAPYVLAAEKEMQLSRISILGVFGSAIAYVVAIGLALAGAGIWSLLLLNVLTSGLGMLSVLWVCRRRLPHITKMHWRYRRDLANTLIKQGLPVGLSNVATVTIVSQYDNFLIGTYAGPATLGFYDRAYRISQWPNSLLTSSLVRVAFLTFAKVKDDLPRLTHTVRLAFWLLVTLGVPIALMIFFGAPDIVQILYGPAWSQSAYFLRYLAIFSLLSPFIALGSSLSIALGHRKVNILITGAQAATLILIGTPLTWWLSSPGTMLGVGITIAVGFILSNAYIFRHVQLSIPSVFGPAFVALVIATIASVLVPEIPSWSTLPPLLRLIGIGITAPSLYLVALVALRPGEMIERLRYVIKMFRRPDGNTELL